MTKLDQIHNIVSNLDDLPQKLANELTSAKESQLKEFEQKLSDIQTKIEQFEKNTDQIILKNNNHLDEVITKYYKISRSNLVRNIINIALVCLISTSISIATYYCSLKYFKPFVALNSQGDVTIDKSNVSIWNKK